MVTQQRRFRLAFLALLLLLAAFLRFYRIAESGIWDLDEGLYLTEAHAKWTEWHWCADMVRQKWSEMHGGPAFTLADYLPRMHAALSKEYNFAAKHGYHYLIAVVMLFFGPKVWTGITIDAAAGVAMVWALYRYVAALHSKRAGLIAASLIAISGYHVFYSRRVYGTAIIALLFTLALWSHYTATKRRGPREQSWFLYLAGFCAGLCFVINFQIAAVLPVLPVVHVLMTRRSKTPREWARWLVRGGALIVAGFVTPIALSEASSYPLILLFRSQGLNYPHGTFIERVIPKLTSHLAHPASWPGLILFPFFFSVLDGWPVLVACACLPVLAIWGARQRGGEIAKQSMRYSMWVYLGVSFLVPFLIFSLKTPQSSRVFVNCLPPFFALLGVLAAEVWIVGDKKMLRRGLVAVLLCAIGVSSLIRDAESLRTKSALPELMTWLSNTPERSASAPYGVVLLSYLREFGLEGGSYTTYTAYKIPPPPYFVADRTELWDGNYPDQSVFLAPRAEPVQRFANRFGRMMLEADAFPPEGETFESIQWVKNLDLVRAEQVLVFDVRQPGEMRAFDSPASIKP